MKKSVHLKGLEALAKDVWEGSSKDWAFNERPGIISMFCFTCSRLEQMPAGQIQRAFGVARGRDVLMDMVKSIFNRHVHEQPKKKPAKKKLVKGQETPMTINGNLAVRLELDL